MQELKIKETLNEVVCNVLEQTAFMFPEPADLKDGISFDEYDFNLAKVSFGGDRTGDVYLIVPTEFCSELAANMLGEDIEESDSGGKQNDALKEILNIIAGQLLTSLFGEKKIFSLSTPEVSELSKEEFFSLIEKNDYACSISDDYPVITFCTLEEEPHERLRINN